MLDNNESVNVSEEPDVTDADLDAAFQQFLNNGEKDEIEEVEETVEEIDDTEETVEEIEETPRVSHSESSRLGRKLKRLEQQFSESASKKDIEELNNKIDEFKLLLSNLNQPKEEEEFDEFGYDDKLKKELNEIKALKSELEKQKETTQKAEREKAKAFEYEENYAATLRDLLDEVDDEAVAKTVFKKMVASDSPYNVKLSDNPFADVAKNFARAMRDSIKTKKKGPNLPSGVNTPSSPVMPVKKPVNLDPQAAAFAKSVGMSDEEIDEALSGEMPMSLVGKGL